MFLYFTYDFIDFECILFFDIHGIRLSNLIILLLRFNGWSVHDTIGKIWWMEEIHNILEELGCEVMECFISPILTVEEAMP